MWDSTSKLGHVGPEKQETTGQYAIVLPNGK